jgi:hypothetical protein
MGKETLASRSSPTVAISFQIITHLYRREDVEKEQRDCNWMKTIISADKTPTIDFFFKRSFSTPYSFILTNFFFIVSYSILPYHRFHPHGPLTPTPSARLFGYQSPQRLFSIHRRLNPLSNLGRHKLLPGETKL